MAPAGLLRRGDLSRDDKVRLLHEWERDLREQMVADEENMTGAESPAGTLQDILSALAALGAQPESGTPTKHG
jgi:hypothetical protein